MMNQVRRLTVGSLVLTMAVFILAFFPLPAQGQGRRVALVIGNSSYTKVARLPNPANDATDTGKALAALGFDVIALLDGTQSQMDEAVETFRVKLAGAEAGLFYYAGHGVQSQGANYLIPIDAGITAEYQLRSKALDASMVLEAMNASGCPLNMVILDACRDNPFSAVRSMARGLSVMGSAPAGAIIVYATDPGKTAADGDGRNGVYTTALLRHIGEQGIDVKTMFDRVGAEVAKATGNAQTPWVSSKFYGDYYLSGTNAPGTPSRPQEPNAAPVQPRGQAPTVVITKATGAIQVSATSEGSLWLDGEKLDDLPAGAEASLDRIKVGSRTLEMRYAGGEREAKSVTVEKGKTASATFEWKKAERQTPEQAVPVKPSPIPASSIPRDGLVAEYLFNGDAKDTSGRGNDGVPQHVAAATDRFGQPGKAFLFNGKTSQIQFASPIAPPGDKTVSLWFRSSRNDIDQQILTNATGGDGNESGLDIAKWAYNDFQMGFILGNGKDSGHFLYTYFNGPSSKDGTIHHLVASQKGNAIELYIDGAVVRSSANASGTERPPTHNLKIGASGRGDCFFSGLIDDVRIYDRALTNAEVQALYHEGGWTGK